MAVFRGALVCIVLVLLSACASSPDGAIRFGVSSAPINLDPRFTRDATSARINRLLYRQLVDFDTGLRPVASLASWRVLSPTHYRFVLSRKGRRFHNGKRLTARDVKATYDSVLDKTTASPHRTSVAIIRTILVVDDDTVDFILRKPDPMFPSYLVIGIMPEQALRQGHDFNHSPLGSGPFRFVSWSTNGEVTIQRLRDRQLVRFIHVGDANVRVLKLLRGEIDMLQNDLPVELRRYLLRKKGIYTLRRAGTNFTYLGINFRHPDLARRKVRKAIVHAIDREKIIRYLLGPKTRKAENIFPPEHWASARTIKPYRYDPALAWKLLAQAGYDSKRPLDITYKTSSDPFRIRLATIIQSQLKSAGIHVRLRSFDFATVFGDIKAGRFNLYSLTWVGVKSPDILRYIYHSRSVPPSGGNRGRYVNKMVDRLIEEAETSTTLSARIRAYRDIQKIVHDDLVYIPLWYEEHFFAARHDIKGYRIAGDGNYDSLMHVYRSREKQKAR